MASALGLIRVESNSDMVARERKEAEQRQAAEEANNRPLLRGLAAHVMDCWQDARDAKNAVLPRLRRARRARMGEYDDAKLAAIRQFGGSDEYARITANKCRVVEAWLRDIFLGQTEKPWSLNPTPVPNFPPHVEQQVQEEIGMEVAAMFQQTQQLPTGDQIRAIQAAQYDVAEERLRAESRDTVRRMERLMSDQLLQGGWATAMADFLANMVTYPSAILKGPILRRSKRLSWVPDAMGQVSPNVSHEIAPEFEALDPFRIYPAPGAATPQEGYIIEHGTYSYQDLYDLIGAPGFDSDAIRTVLRECSQGDGWLGIHTEDAASEDGVSDTLKDKVFGFSCLEFHGPVKGRDLLDWGMDDEDIDDPDATYEACVWLIDRWVIKAQLNYDPLGLRPYYKTSYEELPGQFWGLALPDILDDVQGVANATVRALVNNMGLASGPQVAVNIDRLPPGEDITNLHPWKIWQVRDPELGGNQSSAIEFYQPNTNVHELLAVLEKFYQFADDFSLVPRFMAGSDRVAGAGRTASGLSMLMDAANKGLKGVVSNIDMGILKPMLEKLYAHNMMYAEDSAVKGDAQVIARGAVSLMQLESLQLRRNEFLMATANPLDSQIVGPEGRAEVLREVAKGLELDVSKIVPPAEVLAQRSAAQAAAAKPQGGGAQPPIPGQGETLENGAAVTDNFSPNALTPS